MPIYSRNEIANYRKAEEQEQKMFYKKFFGQKMFYKKFLMYQFKKFLRLFLEIASLYKKQNRLISKTGLLINGFLLYLRRASHMLGRSPKETMLGSRSYETLFKQTSDSRCHIVSSEKATKKAVFLCFIKSQPSSDLTIEGEVTVVRI